jgi:hypothetical protein
MILNFIVGAGLFIGHGKSSKRNKKFVNTNNDIKVKYSKLAKTVEKDPRIGQNITQKETVLKSTTTLSMVSLAKKSSKKVRPLT